MRRESGERFLTLKDIAQAVAFDKSEHGISRTMRQIRHWTTNDILRPYGGKETGTGIARIYVEAPTIDIAAILLEMSRYGVTVDILKPISKVLYEAAEGEHGPIFFGAETDEWMEFIQISWDEDFKTGKLIDPRIHFFSIGDDAEPDSELTTDPQSSIVINLNKVFSRIYPLPWAKKMPWEDD